MSSLETTFPRRGRAATAMVATVALVASLFALLATAPPAHAVDGTATVAPESGPPDADFVVTLDPACPEGDGIDLTIDDGPADPPAGVRDYSPKEGASDGTTEVTVETNRQITFGDHDIDIVCDADDAIEYSTVTVEITNGIGSITPTEGPPGTVASYTLDPTCPDSSWQFDPGNDPDPLPDGVDLVVDDETGNGTLTTAFGEATPGDDVTFNAVCTDGPGDDFEYDPFTFAITDYAVDFTLNPAPRGTTSFFTLSPDCSDQGWTPEVTSDEEGITVELDTEADPDAGSIVPDDLEVSGDFDVEITCTSPDEDVVTYEATYTIEDELGVVASDPEGFRPGGLLTYTGSECATGPGTLGINFYWATEPGADETTPPDLDELEPAHIGSETATVAEDGTWGEIVLEVPTQRPPGASTLVAQPACFIDGGSTAVQQFGYAYAELAPEQPAEERPGPPTDVLGDPGHQSVTISWDPPEDDGGAEITDYLVVASPGNQSCNTAGTSCTVDGLTNGQPYVFAVAASNNGGGDFGEPAFTKLYRPRPNTLPANGFNDVPRASFYAVPVDWAKLFGITTGIGGTNRFGSRESLLRSQIITFMWRFSDQPTGHAAHGFADVPGGTFYEQALRWGRATGVTTGVGNNFYAPDGIVNRAQMITFAYRTAGSPNVPQAHGFVDVPGGTYYENALRWAKAHGVTTGVGGTNRYEPNRAVTRAEAITFLYRLANNEPAWVDADNAPSTVLFDR